MCVCAAALLTRSRFHFSVCEMLTAQDIGDPEKFPHKIWFKSSNVESIVRSYKDPCCKS